MRLCFLLISFSINHLAYTEAQTPPQKTVATTPTFADPTGTLNPNVTSSPGGSNSSIPNKQVSGVDPTLNSGNQGTFMVTGDGTNSQLNYGTRGTNSGGPQTRVTQPWGQFPPKNATCKAYPLTNQTWSNLQLEQHLKNFPGGKNMSVIEYATKQKASNFVCGIGSSCNAGQPCYPVASKDWYILFAIQQWNTYQNLYYEAVGYGIATVQSSLNSLIASLFPASDTSAVRNMKANLGIQAALTQVTGTILMDLMLILGAATGPWGLAFNQLNFIIAAAMGFAAIAIKEPPGPLKDGFEQWSNIAYYLSSYEAAIHKSISDQTNKRLAAGVSSEDGIYGIVKTGNFIIPAGILPLPQVEAQVKAIALALGLNMLFEQINAFITIGSNKCEGPGPNGARDQESNLSWCDTPGGLMHNIVIAEKDKTYNEINNAKVIEQNFGFSTEMIVKSSQKCQEMNKGWRYVPWASDQGALPKTPDQPCVFNIPICDVRDKAIHKKIHDKDWTTARACRHTGKLPLQR